MTTWGGPNGANTRYGFGDMTTDVWGRPITVQPYSLLDGYFTHGICDHTYFTYKNGTGANYGTEDGMLHLIGGTANGAIARVRSRRRPRYQSNRGHHFATATQYLEDTQDCYIRWGLFTDSAGPFFRWDAGDHKLYACIRNTTGVTPPSPEAHTTGSGSTSLIVDQDITSYLADGFDPEKNHIWDIRFQWRGSGDVYWYCDNRLLYNTSRLNVASALSFAVPALPARFEIENVGGSTNPHAHFGCFNISSEGGHNGTYGLHPRSIHKLKTGYSNSETTVLAVSLGEFLGGMQNSRDSLLNRLEYSCDAQSTIRMYILPKADLTVSGAWTLYSTLVGESALEYHDNITSWSTTNQELIATREVTGPGSISFANDGLMHWITDSSTGFGSRADAILLTVQKATASTTNGDFTIDMGEEV